MVTLFTVSDIDEVRHLTGDPRRKREVVLVEPASHYATTRDRNKLQPERGFDGRHLPAGYRWEPSAGFVHDPGQLDRVTDTDLEEAGFTEAAAAPAEPAKAKRKR